MEAHRPIVTRLKIMGGMDIAEKRLPQDGKYRYDRGQVKTDLRISALPTIYGEKIVLRLSLIHIWGYDPVYGARPLKRYLQKHVETLAAKIILQDGVRAGNTIVIDVSEHQDRLIAYVE